MARENAPSSSRSRYARRLLLVILVTTAGCGSGGVDYRDDPVSLAANVKLRFTEAISNAGREQAVATVSCFATSTSRQFLCAAEMEDGEQVNTLVEVSADGRDWASHS